MNSATGEKVTEAAKVDSAPTSAEQVGVRTLDPDAIALDIAAVLVKHFGYARTIDALAATAELLLTFSNAQGDKAGAKNHERAMIVLDTIGDDMPDAGDDVDGVDDDDDEIEEDES